MTLSKIYNKYPVDDKGFSFTAPYNAPEGFSGFECHQCGHEVRGEGVFATGARIVYPEYDHDYQPFEMERLKNLWAICTKCDWNEYSQKGEQKHDLSLQS